VPGIRLMAALAAALAWPAAAVAQEAGAPSRAGAQLNLLPAPDPAVEFVEEPADVRVQQEGEPRVNVAPAAEPQISIEKAEPVVNVEQSQPQVTIEQAEPEVAIEPPEEQPRVTVERAQLALRSPDAQLTGTAGVVGRTVRSEDGEVTGEAVGTVLAEDTGAVEQLIVELGGFLGFGRRQVAIPWEEVRIDQASGDLVVAMSAQEIEDAPTFERPAEGEGESQSEGEGTGTQ
jgi:sporulation protein YlmC with PRC-barrel domain